MRARFPVHSTQSGETLAEYVVMLAAIFVIVLVTGLMVGDRASQVFNATADRLLRFLH